MITVQVNKYTLNPKRIIAGTRGSFGTETLLLQLNDDWDTFEDWVVTFKPTGEAPVSVKFDGEPIVIPQEVMRHCGITEYIVSGYSGKNTLLSLTGEISVLNTLDPEAEYAAEPTATLVGEILEKSAIAESTAKSVRSDADNGLFNGRGISHLAVTPTRHIMTTYTDGTCEDSGEFDINIRGVDPPDSETEGEKGSIYTDEDGNIYYCMGIDSDGGYLWRLIYSPMITDAGVLDEGDNVLAFYPTVNRKYRLIPDDNPDARPHCNIIHIPQCSGTFVGDWFEFEFSTPMSGVDDSNVTLSEISSCYPFDYTINPECRYIFHGDSDGIMWRVSVTEVPLYIRTGKYELINTVTLTEDTRTVTIDMDSNENGFRLSKVMLYTTVPACSFVTGAFTNFMYVSSTPVSSSRSVRSYVWQSMSSSQAVKSLYKADYTQNPPCFFSGTEGTNSGLGYFYQGSYYFDSTFSSVSVNAVKKIVIKPDQKVDTSSDNAFPAGTVFELWGVKA